VSEPGAKTRAAAVANELRRMIRSGELPAGTRLRQDHLAERFGVSSTPVREALTVLARERLVRHDAHRGAVVYPPTAAEVQENFEIRLALEPLATQLAARHADAAVVLTLRELYGRLDAVVTGLLAGDDPSSYEQADGDFHLAIFSAAGRPLLLEMIEALRNAAVAYAHLHTPTGVDADLLARLHAQHAKLIDAIADHDADRAHQLAADHVWLTAAGSGAAVNELAAEISPGDVEHLS
jgi:DNA-binding GntR family transcriptional regulator